MRDALLSGEVERDRAVASAGRVLVLNRLPIASRGRPIGSVTTLRDRTELLELRRELDLTRHVTDTLRAQAHEFSNRLHTIAGLIELGEAEEAVRFVHRVSSSRSEFSGVGDRGGARPLGRRAAHRQGQPGRRARRRPADRAGLRAAGAATTSSAPTSRPSSATSSTTPWTPRPTAPQRWVEVALGLVDGEVEVVVRDSGAGRAAGHGAGGLPPRHVDEGGGAGARPPRSAGSGCRWCTWSAPGAAGT